MRWKIIAMAGVLSFFAQVPSATAHTELVGAVPEPGAAAEASPSEIRLTFSDEVEPAFSSFDIVDGEGRGVETGDVTVEGKEMVVSPEEPLSPGTYTVEWNLLSVDGHRVQGSFTFEVKQ